MKRKEIEFDPEDLIASVEALARHASGKKKLELKTKTLKAAGTVRSPENRGSTKRPQRMPPGT